MNREVARILELVRAFLLLTNRTIERVLRRLKEAQDGVTDTVRSTIPSVVPPKLAIFRRLMAKIIDLVFMGMLAYLIWPPFGPLLGVFYAFFADGIHSLGLQGQSLGKKIMGLQVQRRGLGVPGGWRDSALRNLPAGVAIFFAMIPLWGWVISVLLGVSLLVIEIFMMLRMEDQVRLGDIMADTRVVRLR